MKNTENTNKFIDFLNFKINLYENSNIYSSAEFYRNLLKDFKNSQLETFKKNFNANFEASKGTFYFMDCLDIKNKINDLNIFN